MTANEKYNKEKKDSIAQRKIRIFSSAFDLFSKTGIDSIAITDIAKHAEIGVASIYRYFETKDQIVINTAIWAWDEQIKKIVPEISGKDFDKKNGFEKLTAICFEFKKLFNEDFYFLRFIYFFDSYFFRHTIAKENFQDYENTIKSVKKRILDSINAGINDKSIKIIDNCDAQDIYYTLTHSLFSMVQKMTLSENLLSMNEEVPAIKQIDLLIKMLLLSLKA